MLTFLFDHTSLKDVEEPESNDFTKPSNNALKASLCAVPGTFTYALDTLIDRLVAYGEKDRLKRLQKTQTCELLDWRRV